MAVLNPGKGDAVPGDYWKHRYGTFWLCLTPDGKLVNLVRYTVEEHLGSTISVAEPIEGWWLTDGKWVKV